MSYPYYYQSPFVQPSLHYQYNASFFQQNSMNYNYGTDPTIVPFVSINYKGSIENMVHNPEHFGPTAIPVPVWKKNNL